MDPDPKHWLELYLLAFWLLLDGREIGPACPSCCVYDQWLPAGRSYTNFGNLENLDNCNCNQNEWKKANNVYSKCKLIYLFSAADPDPIESQMFVR